jgi:diphthamide biosynthesis protein 7
MTAYDTVYPADSLEFCPSENALDIFVCGTYKLEDVDKTTTAQQMINHQSRRGQCLIFQVVAPNEQDPLSWLGSRLLFTIHFFQSHFWM